ncbi:hypothetical protein BN938_1737 [Mucinivorans hirudinis]|uniref:Uncharacterized protein n=1 Tax=Mucinivorans hirudinis TaxID=1433126 RepID=A0A060R8K5_9BACT|nr:hypothetical protein BN938_1737 [Mucinivorans hirudinis]
MKRVKISRQTAERIIYITLIVGLVFFGVFKDSESAQGLIRAVKEAFSILIP